MWYEVFQNNTHHQNLVLILVMFDDVISFCFEVQALSVIIWCSVEKPPLAQLAKHLGNLVSNFVMWSSVLSVFPRSPVDTFGWDGTSLTTLSKWSFCLVRVSRNRCDSERGKIAMKRNVKMQPARSFVSIVIVGLLNIVAKLFLIIQISFTLPPLRTQTVICKDMYVSWTKNELLICSSIWLCLFHYLTTSNYQKGYKSTCLQRHTFLKGLRTLKEEASVPIKRL